MLAVEKDLVTFQWSATAVPGVGEGHYMVSDLYSYGDDPSLLDRSDAADRNSFQPPQKSSLVKVEIGGDRLPTRIALARGWKQAFDASQYGRSIMDAYQYARYELMMRYVDSGTVPESTLPSLRDVTPMLLQARTYEEYRDLYDRLYSEPTFTVYGPGYNEYDEPALTVTATLSELVSVEIDPNWAGAIDSNFIAQDIVECCEQIRAKKPRWVRDIYLDQESDRELAARLVRHEQRLLRNEF
ncbi:hypothetical protein [Nocardia exalbida]|uniref:hypothetical protein n=1 Tax=Nocardia exalbida TaxID=290231 RepID=UPI0012F6F969|nr:hypothetical protein [Nocardia exalbida]